MSPIAHLALAEFTRRKASVDTAVAENRYPRSRGEALLGRWLAVALNAGVPPRAISALNEWWQDERDLSDAIARELILGDCPPPAAWRAELARARDTARERAQAHPLDRQLQERNHALQCLGIHLGCPPDRPADQPLKEAA